MSRLEAGRRPQHENNNTLDTSAFPANTPRWLSLEQIRKMQRCRRETVLNAMLRGELPFEQRGPIRYARLTDVIRWEERRLSRESEPVRGLVHPDLEEFV